MAHTFQISNTELKKIIGNAIRQLREQKGISRNELAKKSGISPASIQRIENEEYQSEINLTHINMLCSALNVTLSDIIPIRHMEDISTNVLLQYLPYINLLELIDMAYRCNSQLSSNKSIDISYVKEQMDYLQRNIPKDIKEYVQMRNCINQNIEIKEHFLLHHVLPYESDIITSYEEYLKIELQYTKDFLSFAEKGINYGLSD